MTAVLSPASSSPSSSPRPPQSASPNPNIPSLPPLVTSNPRVGNPTQRQSSYAKARLSTYSQTSTGSKRLSRPSSTLMPVVRSSLPYAQVRDFAYALTDPLHFGPLPISAPPSGQSTPAFESQLRLSDLPTASSEYRRHWGAPSRGAGHNEHLPQVAYSGSHDDHGPPYSEDEDLQSPVVVTSRHRWWPPGADGRSPAYEGERSYFAGVNGDGSETYYVGAADEMADGPGGELVTYPSDHVRHSSMYNPGESGLNPGSFNADESRYSREYQFTIASPDEEMHGKAVALFDFARENENELPLVEGQVIWVSYRHGQGWLVAEDPRTHESGLVPEEYVRLLRDIEGGWSSLNDAATQELASPDDQEDDSGDTENDSTKGDSPGHQATGSSGSNGEKHPPVVSTFSTSSKDLDHYPHPDLGTQTGQQPPQVVHYNSQANTPTTTTSTPKKAEPAEKEKKDKKDKNVKRSASSKSRKENRR